MATQVTWADIAASVAEIHSREGAKPNRTLYLSLANEFLAMVSERTEIYRTYWTNSGTPAENVITGGTWPLPIDLIKIERVEWDGTDQPLECRTTAWLDEECTGWRDASGEPSYYAVEGGSLVLDTNPEGTTTNKLVVRGIAYLPELTDTVGADNPLAYLPVGLQRCVADYILANLPFDPEALKERMRAERYSAKIQLVLDRMQSGSYGRQQEPLKY